MDDTREKILATALSLFAAEGYNGVGVQRVCALAGITKPTLYYHFGSKRGLLDTILSEHFSEFLGALDRRGTYRGDVAAGLEGSLSVFLEFARNREDWMRLRLALSFSPPSSEEHAAMLPYTERLYEFFRGFFRAAAADHGNMAGRDGAYAASFIGTADAYAGLRLAGALDLDDAVARRVVHYFMHGIFS